jgi:hypothetical protein
MSSNETSRESRTLKFWAGLLEYSDTRTDLFRAQKPTKIGGFGIGFGRTGIKLGFLTRVQDSTVVVEIDCPDPEKTLESYLYLQHYALAIRDAFGGDLEWNQATNRDACYIRTFVQGGWKSPMEAWPGIHKEMIDKAITLDAAIRPYVSSIPA